MLFLLKLVVRKVLLSEEECIETQKERRSGQVRPTIEGKCQC